MRLFLPIIRFKNELKTPRCIPESAKTWEEPLSVVFSSNSFKFSLNPKKRACDKGNSSNLLAKKLNKLDLKNSFVEFEYSMLLTLKNSLLSSSDP